MTSRAEHLAILTNMFTDNVNYPFDGEEEVSDVKTMATRVLSYAGDVYSEGYHYRECPNFKDFLYTHHVDGIAYSVYIGDME